MTKEVASTGIPPSLEPTARSFATVRGIVLLCGSPIQGFVAARVGGGATADLIEGVPVTGHRPDSRWIENLLQSDARPRMARHWRMHRSPRPNNSGASLPGMSQCRGRQVVGGWPG